LGWDVPRKIAADCAEVFESWIEQRARVSKQRSEWKLRIETQLGDPIMKRLSVGPFAVALLSLVVSGATAQTQTPEAAKRTAGPFSYDVAHEVTLQGTVSSLLAKPAAGMIMGSHLLLTTPSGRVDASLGRFGLLGDAALRITAGQEIEVTGVMKMIRDKQVLLVRVVKAGGRVYEIRNEHGVPVSPQAHERASRKLAGEGL
jgi:hypothetical protein